MRLLQAIAVVTRTQARHSHTAKATSNPTVVGRWIFYNDSQSDGNNTAINSSEYGSRRRRDKEATYYPARFDLLPTSAAFSHV